MTRAIIYENLLKCVSGLVLTAILFVIVVETDLLPPRIRLPLRTTIQSAGEQITRLPGLSKILNAFR